MKSQLAIAVVAAIACGCAPVQPARDTARPTGITVEQHPSPNFDARRPNFVVIHHTGGNRVEGALGTLTDPATGVSSHYLISRDGRILQLVDERARAWHAGESYWGGVDDLNSASIGIELDNDGYEPYAEPMIAALLGLLADIRTRYDIPASNFVGHGDVAPGRKVDPGSLFPWRRLAAEGYGLWCDPPYTDAPPGVDTTLLLHAFGYSVAQPYAAIAAFKRRFVPEDPSPLMTEKDRAILYCLVMQKQM